ncbi:MAG: hypothetical protein ABIJ34_07280 [archaeon]
MNKKIVLLFSVLIMMIAACTPYRPYEPTGDAVSPPEGINVDISPGVPEENSAPVEAVNPEESSEEAQEPTELVEEPENTVELVKEESTGKTADIVAYEGDLIDLKPFVNDPDGDPVKMGYTEPFDADGVWQTVAGDAGFYSVIVSATDGKDSFVTKQMTIDVLVKNKAPVIAMPDKLEFVEGDLIRLNPQISDSDGDEVVVIYSGWIDSKTYQTTFDDAGTYKVTIRADDGKEIVTKDVTIVVNPYNRMPVVNMLSPAKIIATEGDLVEIKAEGTDPDGDIVSFSYSEPFDAEGKWQTEAGDAGEYEVSVRASDGKNEVVNEVLVELSKKNTAPEIKSITLTPGEVVLKKPGDEVTITINVEAYDVDGDSLEVSYSGFMDASEKTVKYGEKGGQKKVTVTISDGTDSVSQDISFNMNNWPCFDCQ